MKSLPFVPQNPGFHLHDCYITDVTFSEHSLFFELRHGMYVWKGKEYEQTGPARLMFSDLLHLECEIQYLRDNRRECVDVRVLQKDLENGYIDMIHEMYHESAAHFEGILILGKEWKTVEINIFFQKFLILYEEEGGAEHE